VTLQERYDLDIGDLRELPVPLTHGEEHGGDERTDEFIDQRSNLFRRLLGRDAHREDERAGSLKSDGLDRAAHRPTRGHSVVHQDDRSPLKSQRGPPPPQMPGESGDLFGLSPYLCVELFGSQTESSHLVPVHVADPTLGYGTQSVFPIPRCPHLPDHEEVQGSAEPVCDDGGDGHPSPGERHHSDPGPRVEFQLVRKTTSGVHAVEIRRAGNRHESPLPNGGHEPAIEKRHVYSN
jgi:hypothetical protein